MQGSIFLQSLGGKDERASFVAASIVSSVYQSADPGINLLEVKLEILSAKIHLS